jgi:hypothetical protein
LPDSLNNQRRWYYIYLWADLCELIGDVEQAKRLYALFLTTQSEFKPDKTDAIMTKYLQTKRWFDVEDAIDEAQQRG